MRTRGRVGNTALNLANLAQLPAALLYFNEDQVRPVSPTAAKYIRIAAIELAMDLRMVTTVRATDLAWAVHVGPSSAQGAEFLDPGAYV